MKICICCKQPVEDALAIETKNGVVHSGYCYQMVTEKPAINESEMLEQEQLVEETMLLL